MTPTKMALNNKRETIKKEKRGRYNVYLYDSLGYTVYYNGRVNYYTKYLSITLGNDGSISISTSTRFVKDLYISAAGERYDM